MLRTSVSVSGALGRVAVVVAALLAALAVLAGDAAWAAGPTVDLRVPGDVSGGRGQASTTVKAHELIGLRTAESNTYELDGGQRVARVFAQPVNYRDAAGDWQAID